MAGIELLPPITPSGWEKLFNFWARRVGIPLLIGLQLILLLLFASRAKLEFDLRNLDSSVKEREETLAREAEFEKLFRNTQAKLAIISTVKEDLCASCAVDKLYSLKSSSIKISNLSLEEDRLIIAAQTPQATAFSLFIDRILKEEGIREAAITGGGLAADGQFSFSLELILDKEKIK